MNKVDLVEEFALVTEPWRPRVVAELNGQHIRLARFRGEYTWHRHQGEDEAFLVVQGAIQILLRDGVVDLAEGELLVVPRGVAHRPRAAEDALVLLFEPATTIPDGGGDGG